jgi:hypothetical protein
MLAAEEFHTWDARANRAITHLCPAIDHAIATGRPVGVTRFPSSYGVREFVALAVDLCRRADVNVAVVSTSEDSISIVPLSVTPRFASREKLEATRPVRRRVMDTRAAI